MAARLLFVTVLYASINLPQSSGEEEVVCRGLDLRSDVGDALRVYKMMSLMNNTLDRCTVIEGNVHLLLIQAWYFRSRAEYNAVRFPRVREITGYLLIFEFSTMTSVGHIFPQLRIIRGLQLVQNYALIIYRNPDLAEIGLTQLREISRGGVRISSNPKLCYVQTVNWSLINKGGTLVIENNKSSDLCGVCDSSSAAKIECAKFSERNVSACWNRASCQKTCSNECNSSNSTCGEEANGNRFCCHPECLAGCTGPEATDCIACRHVLVNGSCQKTCPTGYFEYLERRCVTANECRAFKTSYERDLKVSSENRLLTFYGDNEATAVYYKPINSTRSCSPVCPPDYEENPQDRYSCRKCSPEKGCTKVCNSALILTEGIIHNVADAKRLKGCTVIRGNLDISIRSTLSEYHLESLAESLSRIVEVTGYVKVSFSKSLTTLGCLKNLQLIRGKTLWTYKYALTILQNENLVSMWNESHLKIFEGGIQFHNNQRLCMNRIDDFVKKIDLMSPSADKDISVFSNGDIYECNTVKLKLTVTHLENVLVALSWTPYYQGDFIGYKVYYRAIESEPVDINANRDPCSDKWSLTFYEKELVEGTIRNLTPHTLYAFYVQTSTVHGRGVAVGISDVRYVLTRFSYPDPPILIKRVGSENEIYIEWQPPEKTRGEITHYKISITKKQRPNTENEDYCSKTFARANASSGTTDWVEDTLRVYDNDSKDLYTDFQSSFSFTEKPLNIGASNDVSIAAGTLSIARHYSDERCSVHKCCACEETKQEQIDLDKNMEVSIFEDRIYDVIFPAISSSFSDDEVKSRRKRSTSSATTDGPEATVLLQTNSIAPFNNSNNNVHQTFTFNGSSTNFTFQNLEHFTSYVIKVWACQNTSVKKNYCSEKELSVQITTLPSAEKDAVDISSIRFVQENNTLEDRLVFWKAPPDPNGPIIAFEIRYKRTDSVNHYSKCLSVSDYSSDEHSIQLSDLSPGEYQFRIRAVSQANVIRWTDVFFSIRSLSVFDMTLTAVCTTITFLLLCVIIIICYYTKRRRLSEKYMMQFFSANPDYFSQMEVYQRDEWELNRCDIELMREIGSGTFGKVYEGRAAFNGEIGKGVLSQCGLTFTECAVKTVAEKADIYDKFRFLIEASVMKQFTDAAFIVKLFGVVSEGHPTLVVMELMHQGSLKQYLTSRRPDPEFNTHGLNPPTYEETLKMAAEIADGMAYLEAHQFCHRDLAARNCLVAADGTCKIGDFGMTRNLYYRDYYKPIGRRLMPIRWMSPEALRDAVFTSKSDVWSYGILLWEIVTLCQPPYTGLNNEEIFNFVVDLKRSMGKPTGCPFIFETLMRQCWQYDPKNRPTFDYFVSQLEPYQQPAFHKVSYFCKTTRCLAGAIPECSENDYLLGAKQRKIQIVNDPS